MSRPVPDLFVEQHHLGEFDAKHTALLQGMPDLDARMAALDASDASILQEYPPTLVVPAVTMRARQRRSAWMLSGLALAATVLLAVAVAPRLMTSVAEPTERTKGLEVVPSEHLQLHRLEGSDAVALTPGSVAHTGDRVQVSYVASGRYGVIVSVDGRGAVTLHGPESGARAMELARGGARPLPQSYELDDAPAFERFFFVTGDDAFDVEVVRKAAMDLASDPGRASDAPLTLPAGLQQESFLLRKEAP